MSKDAHDFDYWTTDLIIMFNNANETICDDCNMYLNADSILIFSPKGLDLEVLLDPLEEQLNLPSVFVQKSNLFCFKEEVVGIVRKRPVQFWSIINNASNRSWIVAFVSLAAKPDSLVTKDIVLSVKQVFTLLNLIIGTKLLSDNEECSSFFNGKEPCKIKVSTVKDIARKLLILNPVHGVDIMNVCISDSVEYWNLCCNINLRVNSDSRFCSSECSPSKNGKAEVNNGGVNSIETSTQFKLFRDSSLLGLTNHIEGKLFIDSVITESVGLGDNTPIGGEGSETEIVRTFGMSLNDVNKFPKTRTTRKLCEYKHAKMIPMSEAPAFCSVVVFADNTIELTLEPICDLMNAYLLHFKIGCKGKRFKCGIRFAKYTLMCMS